MRGMSGFFMGLLLLFMMSTPVFFSVRGGKSDGKLQSGFCNKKKETALAGGSLPIFRKSTWKMGGMGARRKNRSFSEKKRHRFGRSKSKYRRGGCEGSSVSGKNADLRKKGESGMDFWKIARSGKERMKLKFRNLGTGQWVVLLLLGLLLAVAALPVSHKGESKKAHAGKGQWKIQCLKRNWSLFFRMWRG